MDQLPRERYHTRRQQIERQRRIAAIAVSGVALIVMLAVLALNRTPPRPLAVATPSPTAGPGAPAPTRTRVPGPGSTATPLKPVVQPTIPPGVTPTVPPLAPFFDDQRLSYEPDFYATQIQAFLDTQPGPLKRQAFQLGDRRHSFAETLSSQTSYYSVNPKVLLALLESQNRLLSSAGPTSEQVGWAIGFQGENGRFRGLQAQVRWATKQIFYARRDYPQYGPLTYADGSSVAAPPGMRLSEFAIARVLAPTTTPDRLPGRMNAFLDTYAKLFGDPRVVPIDWPAPAEPFLNRPTERTVPVSSFFDHGGPFLTRNDSVGIMTYWGRQETDIAFAYNGHDGWDYAAAPPDLALAATNGEVVFAGAADDGCGTLSVVIDHKNGYRTLYWHLHRVDVAIGEQVASGQPIGMIGNTGCSLGPHLHFGVQYLGRNTDPYGWCANGAPDPWQAHPAGTLSTWLWADRPSPCAPPPEGAVVVDPETSGFAKAGNGWQAVPVGFSGGALFVPSIRGTNERRPWELHSLTPPDVAVWKPVLPVAGRYRVLAYIPYALSGLVDASAMRYRIHYAGGEAEVRVNSQIYANDWADLGTYEFSPDDPASIVLSNMVEDEQRSVWADAIMWIPVP